MAVMFQVKIWVVMLWWCHNTEDNLKKLWLCIF